MMRQKRETGRNNACAVTFASAQPAMRPRNDRHHHPPFRLDRQTPAKRDPCGNAERPGPSGTGSRRRHLGSDDPAGNTGDRGPYRPGRDTAGADRLGRHEAAGKRCRALCGTGAGPDWCDAGSQALCGFGVGSGLAFAGRVPDRRCRQGVRSCRPHRGAPDSPPPALCGADGGNGSADCGDGVHPAVHLGAGGTAAAFVPCSAARCR
jgi:hypothetical protein